MAKTKYSKNFWENQPTKTGRKRIFSDPNVMWKKACEYFEWVQNNPLKEYDYRGKDSNLVVIDKMRVFTITGLCLFFGVHTQYLDDFERLAIAKQDNEVDKEFSVIISRIRMIISNQKFEGASSGFFNATIIARDLGLVERKHIDTQIKISQSEWEEKFEELPESDQLALLSLAERLGYEDADFEDIE